MFQDSSDESFGGSFHAGSGSRRTGDSDLDAAYDELNDFLNKDLSDSERRARDEGRRSQAAHDARASSSSSRASSSGSYSGSSNSAQSRPGHPQGLINDYRVFNLPVGSKLPEIRAVYKKILMEFHPDRHAGNPEMLKKATEYSSKVNAAYQRLEHYLETGKYQLN